MRGFIFDMDGVIIDSEPLHFQVEQDVCKKYGVELAEKELESYVGTRARDMWQQIKKTHGATFEVSAVLNEANKRKQAYVVSGKVEPISGIKELLAALKNNGYRIGLASSSPRPFIEAVLNSFGISDYFDVVMSGEEVANGKPAPDVYRETAEKLGVQPDACTVLEDAAHGVQAALAAGMRVIGFVNPNSGSQDLSAAHDQVNEIGQIQPQAAEIVIEKNQ